MDIVRPREELFAHARAALSNISKDKDDQYKTLGIWWDMETTLDVPRTDFSFWKWAGISKGDLQKLIERCRIPSRLPSTNEIGPEMKLFRAPPNERCIHAKWWAFSKKPEQQLWRQINILTDDGALLQREYSGNSSRMMRTRRRTMRSRSSSAAPKKKRRVSAAARSSTTTATTASAAANAPTPSMTRTRPVIDLRERVLALQRDVADRDATIAEHTATIAVMGTEHDTALAALRRENEDLRKQVASLNRKYGQLKRRLRESRASLSVTPTIRRRPQQQEGEEEEPYRPTAAELFKSIGQCSLPDRKQRILFALSHCPNFEKKSHLLRFLGIKSSVAVNLAWRIFNDDSIKTHDQTLQAIAKEVERAKRSDSLEAQYPDVIAAIKDFYRSDLLSRSDPSEKLNIHYDGQGNIRILNI